MDNVFKTRMQSLSDFKLYKIIFQDRKHYKEEAFQAAKTEFDRRNIAPKRIERILSQLELEHRARRRRKKEHLDPYQKLLFFMFFWAIIPWSIAGTFKVSGYERKYKEAWKSMRNGFYAFLLSLVILLIWMFVSLQTFPTT